MTLAQIIEAAAQGERFRVQGGGIAYAFVAADEVDDEETEWTGQRIQTGQAVLVMIGDDRRHVVDPEDVTIAADYCRECGQIGCTADGRVRV